MDFIRYAYELGQKTAEEQFQKEAARWTALAPATEGLLKRIGLGGGVGAGAGYLSGDDGSKLPWGKDSNRGSRALLGGVLGAGGMVGAGALGQKLVQKRLGDWGRTLSEAKKTMPAFHQNKELAPKAIQRAYQQFAAPEVESMVIPRLGPVMDEFHPLMAKELQKTLPPTQKISPTKLRELLYPAPAAPAAGSGAAGGIKRQKPKAETTKKTQKQPTKDRKNK